MLKTMGQAARKAAWQLASLSTDQKNQVLLTIADLLLSHSTEILKANQRDIDAASDCGMSDALLDRLLLTTERIQGMANEVLNTAKLIDPVGKVIDGGALDSGLRIERRRVPLGVVAVIYEARPNVTVDVASLCLKTGNAVILRGGKETIHTNQLTVSLIQQALSLHRLPATAVQVIDNPDRQLVTALLGMHQYVDMLIPRGGAALHKLCRQQSTIPVITGGIGVCHLYLDESMAIQPALDMIVNAKKQRPGACNSLETLLIHQSRRDDFLPVFGQRMSEEGIVLHADNPLINDLTQTAAVVLPVEEQQYQQEWLSNDLNIKLVRDMDDAIAHIRQYSTQHSDGILTRDQRNADKFIQQVDSAVVYINASTRFTDGAQFGLGAEVAVSTQKLHARGPMGLEALTTYKWICWGQDSQRQ